MHTSLLPLALIFSGCSIDEALVYPPCTPTYSTVAVDDSSLGFSAGDVVAMLTSSAPSGMVWDELTLGDASTDAAVGVTLIGEPSLADPTVDADCDQTPWLELPVTMDITLAGGDVSASGDTTLYVTGLTPAEVSLYTDWELPATLSGDYADQFDTYFAEEWSPRGYELHGTYVTLLDTWAEPSIDIAFQAGVNPDKSNAAGAVWRGFWTLPG